MSLSIGIVGLPNVGKSTLFNALTDGSALAANYPFATIEPNTGIVPIPDPRLEKLAQIYSKPGVSRLDGVQGRSEQQTEPYMKYGEGAAQLPTQQSAKSTSGAAGSASRQAGAAGMPRIIPATVTFVDIAGLVAGASQGEGLGNQFLANIRSCNAICHVVRVFDDPNVQHVDAKTDPKQDIEVINTELILADLQTLERRLPKVEKEAKADPKLKPMLDSLQKVNQHLDDGKPLSAMEDLDHEVIANLQLLTAKPVIYVFNVDEETLVDEQKKNDLIKLVEPAAGNTHLDALQGASEERPKAYIGYDEDAPEPGNAAMRKEQERVLGSAQKQATAVRVSCVFICAKLESELRDLDETDRTELLNSYGQKESGLVQLIHAVYDKLDLQSYLTAGEKEVRAWTIAKETTAPQAAGVIHTDFERGFIAAQVVDYNDLIAAGSEQAAKSAGKIRTEGKTYIMQPNDVVEFRFNV